jgi:hypothetical protein
MQQRSPKRVGVALANFSDATILGPDRLPGPPPHSIHHLTQPSSRRHRDGLISRIFGIFFWNGPDGKREVRPLAFGKREVGVEIGSAAAQEPS